MPENEALALSEEETNICIQDGPYTLNRCAPDTQYVFDGLVQLGHVSPEVLPWFEITGVNMNKLLDEVDDLDFNVLANNLITQYEDWRTAAPVNERLNVSMEGFCNAWMYMGEVVDSATCELVDRYMGLTKPTIWTMIETNLFKLPDNLYIPDESNIASDANIEHIVQSDLFQKLEEMSFAQCYRLSEDLHDCEKFEEFLNWRETRLRQIRGQAHVSPHAQQDYYRRARGLPFLDRNEERAAKKALKRSVKLFQRFLGKKRLNVFMQGDSFTLEGKQYNYYISRNTSTDLIRHTARPDFVHTPYTLELYTKDNIYLAQACVYFENTPILDQIVGFYLHLQADDEDHLLEKMNFFNTSEAFRQDRKLCPAPPENTSSNLSIEHIVTPEDRERQNERQFLVQTHKDDVKRKLFGQMRIGRKVGEMMYSCPFNLDEITQNKDVMALSNTRKLLTFE